MRVIGESEQLPAPQRCFICETHPQREYGVLLVDTGFNFDPPAPTPITGRKIVCSRCVQELANLLGYRDSDQVDEAKTALEDARRFLQPLQSTVQSLAFEIGERVDKLFNLPNIEQTETSPVVKEKREKDKETDESA